MVPASAVVAVPVTIRPLSKEVVVGALHDIDSNRVEHASRVELIDCAANAPQLDVVFGFVAMTTRPASMQWAAMSAPSITA